MSEKEGPKSKVYLIVAIVAIVCILIGFFVGSLMAPAPAAVTQTVTKTETIAGPGATITKAVPYVSPGGKIWVPILNKYMTHDEIVEEIKKEGKVIVADWTYWGLVDTYFLQSFKKYVKDRYGVDVDIDVVGTQEAKGGFMYQLYSAYAAGMPAPYDVMHIEVNFFEEAIAKDVAEPFLPSPLVPNLNLVDPFFFKDYLPYGVQFQQHAFCAPVVNLEHAGWVDEWTDFADPRLKGKITLWSLTDNGFWGFLVTIAAALGKDYKNPDQMKEVLEWVAKNIHPNVLKYTSDEAEIIELSEKNITWINCYWCCSPEMEQAAGRTWLGPVLLKPFMPNLPGVVWIPKKVQRPILAQLYVDWLLSPDFQFPDINAPGFAELDRTTAKQLWAGMTEGPLGYYYEQFIPEWWGGKENYYKVFPTIEQVKKFAAVKIDWIYVNEHAPEWVEYYQKLIGG
ncbi:MAG: ABC transporter substrate-binding protein [Nitrososphaerota archaeon]